MLLDAGITLDSAALLAAVRQDRLEVLRLFLRLPTRGEEADRALVAAKRAGAWVRVRHFTPERAFILYTKYFILYAALRRGAPRGGRKRRATRHP